MNKTSVKPRKSLLIDTSVILHDPIVMKHFSNSDVHIPFSVIEEIDQFKRDMGEKGRNARHFSRYLDLLRTKQGSLVKGVDLEKNSKLYVSMDSNLKTLPPNLNIKYSDNRILALALELMQKNKLVEILSKDINLRIKADIFNIPANDCDQHRVSTAEILYTGIQEMSLTPKELEHFREDGFLEPKADIPLYKNQYVIMASKKDRQVGRFCGKTNQIIPITSVETSIWGIRSRNLEQTLAIDALMNDDIPFVSLLGKAGTGKTLLAMAVGLQKTLNDNHYQRLLVSRPVFPMGRDIGYLPGDISQKLHPWMQPIYDSMDFLIGLGKKSSELSRETMSQGLVQIEPLAYIRGRSLPRQFLIVDEAQNLTPHEVKTIITRAGTGTKVVLTGDCHQIDNPYVDASSSGLTYAIEKFKTESLCSHVTLSQGERSKLAELAANVL